MQLSSQDAITVLQQPQQTTLHLSIFQPRTILGCRVNDAVIAKGARTIAYDTVSTGSFSSIESGMTLLVGTSPGARDIGKIRIKSATSSQIIVAENSNILWADNLYLTVLRYWEVWPIYPRIINDPANIEDVIFYKDYDIPYTNQNTILGTFACAGPHRAAFVENGQATIFYSATGTYNLLGSPISYNWAFEGGTPTGSTSVAPGNVAYSTPGHYVTRLITTASNGAIDTTYRHISIYNRPENSSSNNPILKWEVGPISGSRAEGGYNTRIKILDEIININDGDIVVLWSDDWYGDQHRSLGGNALNNSSIFLVGHVMRDTIEYDYKQSTVSFDVGSITDLMKDTEGFSVSVESTAGPYKWFELLDMDGRRALYHYLKWHTTVLMLSDFGFIGTDKKIQYFDADRTSLYDAADNFMRDTLVGKVVSDIQGKVWAEIDASAYPNPSGSFSNIQTITKRDWLGEPSIEERLHKEVSYLELGGVAYSGAYTGTFAAKLSCAPGVAPDTRGRMSADPAGLALESQDQLNTMIGNIFASMNSRFPTIGLDMSGNDRQFDISPQISVGMNIQSTDTNRGVAIIAPYLIDEISWTYNQKDKTLLPSIVFKALVNGFPGDTIEIPDTPGDANNGLGFNFPDFSFPPLSFETESILAIIDPSSIDNVIILVKNKGIFYTRDFSSTNPTWLPMNAGLSEVISPITIEVSYTGKVFLQFSVYSVWFAPEFGAPWRKIFDYTQIGNPQGIPFGQSQIIMAMGINRQADDEVLLMSSLIGTIFSDCYVYPFYGSSSGFTLTSPTFIVKPNPAKRFGTLTFGGSSWIFSYYSDSGGGDPTSSKATRNGSALSEIQTFDIAGAMQNTRARLSPQTSIMNIDPPKITIDGGTNWVSISGAPLPYKESINDEFQSIIAKEGGRQIVVGTATGIYGLIYSNNYGASWITGSFVGDVTSVWHITDNAYIISGDKSIYLIPDLINNPTAIFNKTGNLQELITGSFSTIAIRHY